MADASDRTSRRRLLGAVTLALPALAIAGTRGPAVAAQATPTGDGIQRVTAPDWTFGVAQVLDPYPGTMQFPQSPLPGTRYVAAEIEIDNGSALPLAFTPAEVRLRDETGTDYRGGSALGTEPSISPRNLNGGERSRGWVWFTIPANARPVQLVYVGPQPEFRIALGD